MPPEVCQVAPSSIPFGVFTSSFIQTDRPQLSVSYTESKSDIYCIVFVKIQNSIKIGKSK